MFDTIVHEKMHACSGLIQTAVINQTISMTILQ